MTDSAPTVPPLRIAPPPPGWNPRAAAAGSDADRLAHTALILGVVSLVANLLLIPSIIGIVYGRKALRTGTVQRGMAIMGIVTGAVGLASVAIALAIAIPLLLIDRGAILQHEVETRISSGMAGQGTTLTDVTCPKPESPRAGTAMSCTAQATGIGPVRVDVTFTSPSRFTAQVIRTQ